MLNQLLLFVLLLLLLMMTMTISRNRGRIVSSRDPTVWMLLLKMDWSRTQGHRTAHPDFLSWLFTAAMG